MIAFKWIWNFCCGHPSDKIVSLENRFHPLSCFFAILVRNCSVVGRLAVMAFRNISVLRELFIRYRSTMCRCSRQCIGNGEILPRVWEMVNVNLINLILNLWIQIGSFSTFLVPKRETNGLWSVSTLKHMHTRYSLYHSHAQVMLKTSYWFGYTFHQ